MHLDPGRMVERQPLKPARRTGPAVLAGQSVALQRAGLDPAWLLAHGFTPGSEALAGADGDAVLVRWSMADSDSVIELSAQALPPAGQALPLWRHEAAGWPPGRYRVEVLSADAQLRALAGGEFEVVAQGQAMTPATHTADATGH